MSSEHEVVLLIALTGLMLQAALSVWVIVTINRLLRTQTVALGLMQALAARSGFKETIDKVQAQIATSHFRKDDKR